MIIINQFGFASYWLANALCMTVESNEDLHYQFASHFASAMLVTCGIATFLQTTIGSRFILHKLVHIATCISNFFNTYRCKNIYREFVKVTRHPRQQLDFCQFCYCNPQPPEHVRLGLPTYTSGSELNCTHQNEHERSFGGVGGEA